MAKPLVFAQHINDLNARLPADLFLAVVRILEPQVFEESNLVDKICYIDVLAETLDDHMSMVFNYLNDIIASHAEACAILKAVEVKKSSFYLYLRDFCLTAQPVEFFQDDEHGGMMYFKSIPMVSANLQHWLAESTSDDFPVIAIRHLAGIGETSAVGRYLDLPSFLLLNSTWEAVAEKLIQCARGIVVHLGGCGSGTLTEIDLIRKYGRQSETVLVIERNAATEGAPDFMSEIWGAESVRVKSIYKPQMLSDEQIEQLACEFPHRHFSYHDKPAMGKSELISQLWGFAGRTASPLTNGLQDLVSSELQFRDLFAKETIQELTRLNSEADKHLESSQTIGHMVHPLYIRALTSLLLGMPAKASIDFGLIACNASSMIPDPGKQRVVFNRNVGRLAGCMSWSGVTGSEEDIMSRAVTVVEDAMKKFRRT